jgi:hypothetical protein
MVFLLVGGWYYLNFSEENVNFTFNCLLRLVNLAAGFFVCVNGVSGFYVP